jgi:phosphoenolpyruvate phosphomutase
MKQQTLKAILDQDSLSFAMEAHDGLSARLAARAGFPVLWASGLSISTALGYRDRNEASACEVVRVVERIVECGGVPVLVDGDTGFGDFNNARIFARRVQRAGASGVCLEDKQFPKSNSFVLRPQLLADVDEFCGRLRAIKDFVPDPQFVLVARTEAFVCGRSLEEALERCSRFHAAGADAVLVHSKLKQPDEILAFMARWKGQCPVAIVPTTYFATPTEAFARAGISLVIWANHGLRAAMRAMDDTYHDVLRDESVAAVEPHLSSVPDIFALFDYDQLERDERRYCNAQSTDLHAVNGSKPVPVPAYQAMSEGGNGSHGAPLHLSRVAEGNDVRFEPDRSGDHA